MKRMMKTAIFTIVAASLFVLAGAAFAATEFRISNQLPPSHHISKGIQLFAQKVAEYSKNAVTAKVFDSAQLFKDTEIVEALQDNTVEVGLVSVNKWSGMIPVADFFELPFVFKDLTSPKKFIEGGAGVIFDAEFQKKGVKDLFWVDYGYIQFFNSKRPLTKPEDFKGLTMRSFGSGDAETLTALGAAPTVMSSSEMYMGLQRGPVDGATTGMPAAVSRKIFEVQKYLTIANYTTAQFVMQANLEWWDSLKQDEKDAILKAGKEAEEWIRGAIAQSEADAEKVIRDAKLEVHTITDAERELFAKATEPVRAAFEKKTGDLGKKLLEIARGK